MIGALKAILLFGALVYVSAARPGKKYIGKCNEEIKWVPHKEDWHQHKYENVFYFRAELNNGEDENSRPLCGKLNHFEDYEVDHYQTLFKYKQFVIRATRLVTVLEHKHPLIENEKNILKIIERKERKDQEVTQFFDPKYNEPEFQYGRVYHIDEKSMGLWTCVNKDDYVIYNPSVSQVASDDDKQDTRFFLTTDPTAAYKETEGYKGTEPGTDKATSFEGSIREFEKPQDCIDEPFI